MSNRISQEDLFRMLADRRMERLCRCAAQAVLLGSGFSNDGHALPVLLKKPEARNNCEAAAAWIRDEAERDASCIDIDGVYCELAKRFRLQVRRALEDLEWGTMQ